MRILIADDHDLIRDAVCLHLRRARPGWRVETVGTLDEALDHLQRIAILGEEKPELILLDYKMPGMAGLLGLERLRAQLETAAWPTLIALFTGMASRDVIENALARGACGIVPKTTALPALAGIIETLVAGHRYAPADPLTLLPWAADRSETERLAEVARRLHLQPFEARLLHAIMRNESNEAIAAQLGCDKTLVRIKLNHLLERFHVRDRSELSRAALDRLGRETAGPAPARAIG